MLENGQQATQYPSVGQIWPEGCKLNVTIILYSVIALLAATLSLPNKYFVLIFKDVKSRRVSLSVSVPVFFIRHRQQAVVPVKHM